MAILDETEFDELMRIQRQMASSIVSEAEVDNKIKVLTIIDEVIGKRKKAQTEKILIECELQGMTEREVLETIDKLKTDDIIFEPEAGYLQKS